MGDHTYIYIYMYIYIYVRVYVFACAKKLFVECILRMTCYVFIEKCVCGRIEL